MFYAVSTHEFFCTIELRSNSLHPPSTSSLQPSSTSRQSQITGSQIHKSQETIFSIERQITDRRGGGTRPGSRSRRPALPAPAALPTPRWWGGRPRQTGERDIPRHTREEGGGLAGVASDTDGELDRRPAGRRGTVTRMTTGWLWVPPRCRWCW